LFGTVRVVPTRSAHRSFRIEVARDVVYAVCVCGWRSDAAMNAGMAGALWDAHRDEMGTDSVERGA
jgi:hypothetical protein